MAVTIEAYRDAAFHGVKALWDDVFPEDPPWNRAEVVIPSKLSVQRDYFFIALDQSAVIGAAMGGYDGHRGWIYSIAVRASYARQGIGSGLVRRVEAALRDSGCEKINLQIRALNLSLLQFYHRLGYEVDDRINMGKRLA